MDLTIRKAVYEDAETMAEIHMRSWEAAYAGIIPDEAIAEKNAGRRAMWAKTLSGENNNYIALCGETPVGLMGIHPSRDEGMRDVGELGAIYLHPDFIGKGFGREMMNFAEETLKQRGFSDITLWVLEENIKARRFYERCGFTFDGAKKEIYHGKPLVCLRYRKDI